MLLRKILTRHSTQWKKQATTCVDREWSTNEIAAFEDAIATHGAELRAVRVVVGKRSMPEVVRFYGHWKKWVFLFQSRDLLGKTDKTTALNLAKKTGASGNSGLQRSLPGAAGRMRPKQALASAWGSRTRRAPSSTRHRSSRAAVPAARGSQGRGGRRPRASRATCYASHAAQAGGSMQT